MPNELHLGYRRKDRNKPGKWLARRYLGNERYQISPIGLADDFQEADDEGVYSFAQAQKRAYAVRVERREKTQPTIADAIERYVRYLKAEKKSGRDAEVRAKALILPSLGAIRLADLTTNQVRDWMSNLSSRGARVRTRVGKDQQYRAVIDVADAARARKSTANRTFTILKAALNRAYDEDLTDNPDRWRKVKPYREVGAARQTFLSLKEAKTIIEAADEASGFKELVRGALETGCRYGELCMLNVGDYGFGKVRVAVSKSGKSRFVRLTESGQAKIIHVELSSSGASFVLELPWDIVDALHDAQAAFSRLDTPETVLFALRDWLTVELLDVVTAIRTSSGLRPHLQEVGTAGGGPRSLQSDGRKPGGASGKR